MSWFNKKECDEDEFSGSDFWIQQDDTNYFLNDIETLMEAMTKMLDQIAAGTSGDEA